MELLVHFELSTGSVVRSASHFQLDIASLFHHESDVKELINMFQYEVTRAAAVLYPRDASQLFKAGREAAQGWQRFAPTPASHV